MNENMEVFEQDGEQGQGLMGLDGILTSGNPIGTLRKALAAGYSTDPAAMTDGQALRIESLEPTLKNLTFTELSTTMANDLLASKKKAESTVEEYSTIDGISEAFTYEEGGIPSEEDDPYSRKFELIKYIGAVGKVTNVLMSTRTLVGPMDAENRRKMLAIKAKLNQVSYFGNKGIVSTEFNGFLQAVLDANLSDNVIDLKGNAPTLENFNAGVNVIENVSGQTSNLRLYVSPTARAAYKNQLMKDKRYVVGGDHASEVEGVKANKLVYDGGEAPMRKDIFLNPRKYPRRNKAGNAFIATGGNAPAAPTATATPAVDATSTLAAATYDYAVVAVNKLGHKTAAVTPAGITGIQVQAGQKVSFTLADGGSGSGFEATGFEIYRRTAPAALATDFRYIGTYAVGATIVDNGSQMPDTGYMFLMEWDTDQVAAYHQLLDMAKFPLANTVDAVRWLLRLYGALIVYNPKKVVVYKNVGSTLI